MTETLELLVDTFAQNDILRDFNKLPMKSTFDGEFYKISAKSIATNDQTSIVLEYESEVTIEYKLRDKHLPNLSKHTGQDQYLRLYEQEAEGRKLILELDMHEEPKLCEFKSELSQDQLNTLFAGIRLDDEADLLPIIERVVVLYTGGLPDT